MYAQLKWRARKSICIESNETWKETIHATGKLELLSMTFRSAVLYHAVQGVCGNSYVETVTPIQMIVTNIE